MSLSALVASGQTPGWMEEPFDGRDHYYIPGVRIDLTNPNLSHDLSTNSDTLDLLKPAYNQVDPDDHSEHPKDFNTCVANATAAAFRYVWRKQKNVPALDPSRLFLYWNSRNISYTLDGKKETSIDNPADNDPGSDHQGTYVRNAMKVLNNCGVCDNSVWPYQAAFYGKEPTADAITKAKESLSLEYARLDPDNPGNAAATLSIADRQTISNMTLLRLRQCLAEGFPVVFGFSIWRLPEGVKLFHQDKDKNWWLVDLPDPATRGSTVGGHAVLAVGFDDGQRVVRIQNSYGTGDASPYFYMKYDWILDFGATSDFWMIRSVRYQPPAAT